VQRVDFTWFSSDPDMESHHFFSYFEHGPFCSPSDLHTNRPPAMNLCMRSKSGRVRTWEWTFAGDFSAFFCSLDHIAWRSVLAGCANHAGKKKWSEIRKTALSRDGYRCRIPACGQTQELTVHHIHPRGLGGGGSACEPGHPVRIMPSEPL